MAVNRSCAYQKLSILVDIEQIVSNKMIWRQTHCFDLKLLCYIMGARSKQNTMLCDWKVNEIGEPQRWLRCKSSRDRRPIEYAVWIFILIRLSTGLLFIYRHLNDAGAKIHTGEQANEIEPLQQLERFRISQKLTKVSMGTFEICWMAGARILFCILWMCR